MDHDGARRLMAEGVEGSLAPSDERELALHLVGCAECKRLYDGLHHAHPALAAIAAGPPPTRAVDTAVRRATTVLRGEADPGPLGRPPTPPALAPQPAEEGPEERPPERLEEKPEERPEERKEPPAWERTTGPLLGEDAVDEDTSPSGSVTPLGPSKAPPVGPIPAPAGRLEGRAPAAPRPEPEAPSAPTEKPSPRPVPPVPPSETRPDTSPRRDEPPHETPPVPADRPRAFEATLPPRPPAGRPPPQPRAGVEPTAIPTSQTPTRISSSPLDAPISRVDEVEQLFDEDYDVGPPGPPRGPDDGRPVGAGPWLAAIAVTIALAVLAAVLLTRGQGIIGGGGDVPEAEEVTSRVSRLFADMKSLKASFSIRRLSLYRLGTAGQSLTYSFANGRYTGRIVYDRAEGYRQEVTLNVNENELERAKIVQTDDETRSLLGQGNELLVEARPPLGPPDGNLRPAMGLLESAVGAAVHALVSAESLEVVGRTNQDGRDLYEVRAAVTPDELTRADRIEYFLDAQTFLPVIIRRSISRIDAGVLGPPDVLTDDAIATAFGDRDRVTTELVELDNTVIDDIILPGDFVLEVPDGTEAQTRDRGFERVTREQAVERLPYTPLFPSLPEGFEERLFAITAENRGWGPGGAYPAPEGVMNASYFDGKTTVVITQRNIPSGPFNLDGSPLQSGGLPITVRPFERAEKRFFYGVSPEVPPHAYGFLGNVFVMASGYAPAEELVGILASLTEPVASPDASPVPEASPSPAASPAA